MHVRPIFSHELDRFAAAGSHPLGAAGFAQFVRELWERGTSRPEWCFVVESGGEILARIVYRGAGEEAHFTGLHLPDDDLSIGKHLFRESLAALQKQGVTRLEAFINSTTPQAAQIRQLLESIGIPLVQEKVRYTWKDSVDGLQIDQRLTYRAFSEGDEATFVDVIRRVSADSLDRLDILQRESLGEDKFAQEYFRLLKHEFEFYPHWWLLAYTPSNELVGHVVNVPYNLHQHEGTIGYIGVVPEQRGHGYIHDILAQGMKVMVQDGIKTIICDTDQLNAPMIGAFERRGYAHTGTVWVYHGELRDLITD